MPHACARFLAAAGIGGGALLAATAGALATYGIGVREQSAYGEGASFAGVAAGGSLSSMFWNPATLTQVPGIQSEITVSGLLPYAAHTPDAAASTLGIFGGTGNIANEALVPALYASWQVNPNLWLGVAVNAPFGITTSFPDLWAGRDYGESSNLRTYNTTPTIAYRFNDWISIGIGVQLQYATANLAQGIGAAPTMMSSLSGQGWGFGMTAGVTVTPMPNLTLGLGYRSAINQKIEGTLALPAGVVFNPPFSTPGSVSTTINLPDVVSLGVRYRFAPQWTALGTFEWANWSRIGTSIVVRPDGSPATVLDGLGGGVVKLPFQYRDGWYAALGAEYQWTDRLAVRAGIGFDRSPVTNQVRIPIVPDNDHVTASVGLSAQLSNRLILDFAYSHLFVKDTAINIVPGNPWFNGAVTYVGNVSSHMDVVSMALRYRWDTAPPAPLRSAN